MNQSYLEITCRRGRPLAAYYYLPRRPGQKSLRTEEIAPGLLVDYARGGKPIGIEILEPEKLTLTKINRVLRALGQPLLTRGDLAPLRVAEPGAEYRLESHPKSLARVAGARKDIRRGKGVKPERIRDKKPRN